MSEIVYEQLKEGLAEIRAFTVGARPAARIHINGLPYVPEQDWMPISTAPKDGQRLLLRLSNGEVFSGWGTELDGFYKFHADGSDIGWINAKHWMPMPNPPHNPEKEE